MDSKTQRRPFSAVKSETPFLILGEQSMIVIKNDTLSHLMFTWLTDIKMLKWSQQIPMSKLEVDYENFSFLQSSLRNPYLSEQALKVHMQFDSTISLIVLCNVKRIFDLDYQKTTVWTTKQFCRNSGPIDDSYRRK